jgi:hypothetical protein
MGSTQKVAKGQTRIVIWEAIWHNLCKEIKISPIAMIPHKLQGYRAIFDLSYNIWLHDHRLDLVNELNKKDGAMGCH